MCLFESLGVVMLYFAALHVYKIVMIFAWLGIASSILGITDMITLIKTRPEADHYIPIQNTECDSFLIEIIKCLDIHPKFHLVPSFGEDSCNSWTCLSIKPCPVM